MLPRRQGTYLEDWNLHTPANWAAVFQRKDDKDQTNWGYVITHLQRHSTIPPHPIIHHEQQKKIAEEWKVLCISKSTTEHGMEPAMAWMCSL